MWDAERAAAGVMLNEAFPGAARMRIATKLKAAANHQVAFCASPATFVFSAPSSLSRIRGVTIVQGPLVTPPSPFLTLCHRCPLPWRPRLALCVAEVRLQPPPPPLVPLLCGVRQALRHRGRCQWCRHHCTCTHATSASWCSISATLAAYDATGCPLTHSGKAWVRSCSGRCKEATTLKSLADTHDQQAVFGA